MRSSARLVKSLFALPTWTRVAALIDEHPSLQGVLGASPSIWACYRFANKVREQKPILDACLDRVAASLHAQLPGYGVDVAIDATDLPDYFYGFKLHMAVCTRTDLPLAWRIETARRNESLFSAPLLDALKARGLTPETCAMDKGYDNNRVMDETRERDCVPIVSLRKERPIPLLPIPYGSVEWKRLYRGRAAIERENGRLKDEYGLAPLRVRGLGRVQLHADLTILARLSQALVRARAIPLAA